MATTLNFNQYRPSQYKSAKLAAEGATKGLGDDMKRPLPSKKQNVGLLQWISEVREHMVEYGMNTVFRITSLSNNIERYFLSE